MQASFEASVQLLQQDMDTDLTESAHAFECCMLRFKLRYFEWARKPPSPPRFDALPKDPFISWALCKSITLPIMLRSGKRFFRVFFS
jgi:hypothetical protein